MAKRTECVLCQRKTVDKLVKKYKPNTIKEQHFLQQIEQLFKQREDDSNPLFATKVHRVAKDILNVEDLYAEEKAKSNALLFDKYTTWKRLVDADEDALSMAVKLAVIGNIIDYGAHVMEEDLEQQINQLLNQELQLDACADLAERIKKAKSILYLGDNAGELVFDKLLIETIGHPNVVYAVRGKPVINDVTLEDAKQVKMHDVCSVISNGYDAPSTLLEYCSDEFKSVFDQADLVISKGMGNLEGLLPYNYTKVFYMLIAKCEPIAALIGVRKGDLIASSLTTKNEL